MLIVDADTSLPHKKADRANIVRLPGALDVNGKGMSPERTIKSFLVDLTELKTETTRKLLHGLKITNPSSDLIRDHFLSDGMDGSGREAIKKCWIKYWVDLRSWGLIAAWAKANPEQVKKLQLETESAVAYVAQRLSDRLANYSSIL